MLKTINNAKLIEIGSVRKSLNWSSMYLKFRVENGRDFWFEISGNNSSPENINLINDFSENIVCKTGMVMTLNFQIKQSENKSTKLYIRSYHITDYNDDLCCENELNEPSEELIKMKKKQEDILKKDSELLERSTSEKENQKKIIGDVVASLTATGLPVGAVAVSGSVSGISAAGITSGLATLGAGTMVGGIAVVAAIGVVSFLGVKWIWKKI